MIELTKAILPQSIEVDGSFYKIHTNFKYFIRLINVLRDNPNDTTAADYMYIDTIPNNRIAGINALINFMNPPRYLPRRTESENNEPVIDYTIDASYIYAAFFEQYQIDIIDTPLHWHKFLALLHGLHDTEFNKIIEYRLWKNETGENTNYTKHMQKLHDAWVLPDPAENEPDEKLEEFEKLLKG